jgi:hypothetical protein
MPAADRQALGTSVLTAKRRSGIIRGDYAWSEIHESVGSR